MTDPNKPDTDCDGLLDGVEDLTFAPRLDSNGNPDSRRNGHQTYRKVHNGRVEILPNGVDGEAVIAHPPTIYNTSIVDRSKVLAKSPNAVWLETDPNNADTDGDGAGDGSEDVNHNGIVDFAVIDRNQTDKQRQLRGPGHLHQSTAIGDGARLCGRRRTGDLLLHRLLLHLQRTDRQQNLCFDAL